MSNPILYRVMAVHVRCIGPTKLAVEFFIGSLGAVDQHFFTCRSGLQACSQERQTSWTRRVVLLDRPFLCLPFAGAIGACVCDTHDQPGVGARARLCRCWCPPCAHSYSGNQPSVIISCSLLFCYRLLFLRSQLLDEAVMPPQISMTTSTLEILR